MNHQLCYRLRMLLSLLIAALVIQSAIAQEGDALMDIGFRPAEHGFSFPNYGNDSVSANLTPVEMVRLFGEGVCKGPLDEEGGCKLSPNARLWMEEISAAMDGGHCEGMAVLSLLLYGEYISPAEFGAELASELSLEDELLQREIALWWATQATNPVTENMIRQLPSEIVQLLIDNMETEFYTLGIYLPDFSGGHAITPYAVIDQGGGVYHIMVYDNNYPGEERFIEVDTNEETWVYTGSTNPEEAEEEYFGDAEISFNGSVVLRITDNKGNDFVVDTRKGGFPQLPEGYRFIRGKSQFSGRSASDATIIEVTDPSYTSIGVSGNGPQANNSSFPKLLSDGPSQAAPSYTPDGKEATSVKITRRGSVAILDGLNLGFKPMSFTINAKGISYQAAGGEKSEIRFRQAISAANGKDFLYDFSGTTSSFELEFDGETGGVRVDGDDDGSTFALLVERYDEDGDVTTYSYDELVLDGSGFASLNAADWGDTLEILIVDEDGNVLDSFSFDNAFEDDDDANGTDDEDDGGAEDGDSGTDSGG